jgi:hypothetical protein
MEKIDTQEVLDPKKKNVVEKKVDETDPEVEDLGAKFKKDAMKNI